MILLQGPESRSLSSRPNGAAEATFGVGENFEDELIWLLSRLEHMRSRLETLRINGRLKPLLDLSAEFVDLVVAFSDEHCAFAVGRDVDEAAARVKDFRLSFTTLCERLESTNENGTTLPDPAIQSQFKRCFAAIQDGTVAFFTVFVGRFSTSRAALPWVEAAASFIVELKKLTRDPLSNHK